MKPTPNTREHAFPAGFAWGAATAAYQVEGAAREDGRGESIWDRFTAAPGHVANGDTGLVACDSYHRYAEDVRLMRDLGLNAYRFSIAWPRVVPEGRGAVNAAGLDYYDRLVDELLANGIEPFPTLYHWDLPQALEDEGGWPARGTVEAFTEYVEVVVARLGDRVSRWITQNEPWVIAWLGYGRGEHAPGRRSDRDALAAAHHVLLSHGRAVEVIRRERPDAKVGITIDVIPIHPLTRSEADLVATREEDGFRNRWILDPVLRGHYPEDTTRRFARILPTVEEGDLEAISAPIDFLGVNYYRRHVVKAGANGSGPVVVDVPEGEHTAVGWEVYPDGLHELLVRLRDEYDPPPLYVTENGAAFGDTRRNGTVDDPERTSYIDRHLDAVARAIADGVPVDGYFVWSLLDNFEWARGYAPRFGLVYVDYGTLERVPKQSYHWYRDFIARQRRGVAPVPS
ncbi:MAG TPA: GH1 family beta-glucosidase [Gaiella sp.]|nr:GH1 family beta-glucosidase [Gaiella sp.]